MKKLRIILLFSLFILIRVIYITNNDIYKTKYKLSDTIITGYINNLKLDENKLQIELKGKEKVLINYYLKNNETLNYELGDYIKVEGTLKKPNHNTNFNLYDYNLYLKSKKIYYIMTSNKIIKIRKNNKLNYKIKNNVINRIKKIDNNYLYTFILGDTFNLDDNIKDSYRNNGISHLFAISGMHITFLSAFLLKLLSKLLKNKYIVNTFVFAFLFFYMFLTNFTPSVIRATFLFMILSFNKLFNIKIKPINVIILILDIMLFINPYYIYNTGFLLSFSVSIGLVLFGKATNNYKNYFVKIFIISLISFLISIPIIINNNNEINLLSPFINVIFVPFISLIIFPISLLTFIIPILNHPLNIILNIEEKLSLLLSNINVNIILKEIKNIYIILYYILIIFVIKKMINKKYLYLLLILITLFIHNNINYLNRNIIISMIDVNQGDSILIEFPNNKENILIDTGGIVNNNYYSLATNTIIPYIKSKGIKKIDYLILTHGDFDHMGEAINIVNNFKVEKVIFNCGEYNDLEKDLIRVLDNKKIKHYSCIKELNIDNNKLYFLNTKGYDNENDNSNVIYTELNNYKFLFMGDASNITEKRILDNYNLVNIDVLKVGHHGSKTSSSKEFINTINPKYSLISVGRNNRYGHPNKEVLHNLNNSKIFRTDQDGSILFKVKNNELRIETCPP